MGNNETRRRIALTTLRHVERGNNHMNDQHKDQLFTVAIVMVMGKAIAMAVAMPIVSDNNNHHRKRPW